MASDKVNEQTRQEWKELGFFYDYKKEDESWIFIGSVTGLSMFCKLLEKYTQNPRNNSLGEHEHYGPYMYLKIITNIEPIITEDSIAGTIEEIKSLSSIIRAKLTNAKCGDQFIVDKEYSKNNKAILCFKVMEDEFDPASADRLINM